METSLISDSTSSLEVIQEAPPRTSKVLPPPSLWRPGHAIAPRVLLSLAATIFCVGVVFFASWVLAITVIARQRVRDEELIAGGFVGSFVWVALLVLIWRGTSIRVAHLARSLCASAAVCLACAAACVGIDFAIIGLDKELLMGGIVFLGASILVLIWATPLLNALARRKNPQPLEVRCPHCSYLMTGLTTLRCPECGTSYTINQLLGSQPDTTSAGEVSQSRFKNFALEKRNELLGEPI